jgi:hypothetical protein
VLTWPFGSPEISRLWITDIAGSGLTILTTKQMKRSLPIGPRHVKQDKDGLRPFQREALEAIRKSDARLIFVEGLE